EHQRGVRGARGLHQETDRVEALALRRRQRDDEQPGAQPLEQLAAQLQAAGCLEHLRAAPACGRSAELWPEQQRRQLPIDQGAPRAWWAQGRAGRGGARGGRDRRFRRDGRLEVAGQVGGEVLAELAQTRGLSGWEAARAREPVRQLYQEAQLLLGHVLVAEREI